MTASDRSAPLWEPYTPEAVKQCLPAAQAAIARCLELSTISSLADGICRTYLSDEHRRANTRVGDWLTDAGLKPRIDAVGNLCARWPADAEDAPVLLLGSHLDTIPNAGPYDGVLGVMLGLAAVETFRARGERLPFHVDLYGFAEEEGVRFGTTLITSLAVAGRFDPDWWQLTDSDGVSLATAFRTFGLDPAAVAEASRAEDKLLGFYEVHIEQGPVLEAESLPLGTVSGIAGNRRLRARVIGQAGHAGTTPMALRRDAGVAAAWGIQTLEALALEQGIMATVGQLELLPGGVNVIPGEASFSVDVRDLDDGRRDRVLETFVTRMSDHCAARGLRFEIDEFHSAVAVPCSVRLQQATDAALAALGHPPKTLPSGAGHDAMAFAGVCDSGMLFLRCTGGISHHPDEHVTATDVAWSLAALIETLRQLARSLAD
ncbi:MAG: allantoate amidohydrolase [Pseudomonadota bacterium]